MRPPVYLDRRQGFVVTERKRRPSAPKASSAGSSPAETGIVTGRGYFGVVRGCPLGTVQDRCEWQASGTAGAKGPGRAALRLHLDRWLRLVVGAYSSVGKPSPTVRQHFVRAAPTLVACNHLMTNLMMNLTGPGEGLVPNGGTCHR
jgi:hypothetical protein